MVPCITDNSDKIYGFEGEIHGSNPVMGNFYSLSTAWKDENKEKEAGNDLFL